MTESQTWPWGGPDCRWSIVRCAGGNPQGTRFPRMIKSDMELLDKIPPEKTELRAELGRTIDFRIRELVAGVERALSCARPPVPTKATGGISWCSSARSCSPSCGGTSRTAGPTGW